MGFREIFTALDNIDKLYSDCQKTVVSRLKGDALAQFEKRLAQSRTQAEHACAALLEAHKDTPREPLLQQIIEEIQRHYSPQMQATQESKYPRHPNSSVWGKFYDHARYQRLMPYCEVAYLEEQNGTPQEHALKLSLMFDDVNNALKYIKENSGQKQFAIHDACLFQLPAATECDFAQWKKFIKININDMQFQKLLAKAPDIQMVIENNRPSTNKKPDRKAIAAKKVEIEETNKVFKSLNRKHGALTNEEKQTCEKLSQKLSSLRLELFKMSAGKKLGEYDLASLIAADEYFTQATQGAYQHFLTHGLTKKDFGKFIQLERKNDDQQIPPIKIDGGSEYPGFTIAKVDVMDEMQAAEAACFGKLTNCCQSLSGEAGEPCVIHGLTSIYGGFYVVKDSNNNVIAQCWAWRSQDNAIVFDSIEIAKKQREHTKAAAKSLFNELAYKLVEDGYTHKVACGARSGISSEFGVKCLLVDREHYIDYDKYSDSKEQRVILDSNKPYLHYGANEAVSRKARALIESMLQVGTVESNRDFIKMLNWAIAVDKTDVIDEIKDAAKKMSISEKVCEIIEKIENYVLNPYSQVQFYIENDVDSSPYLTSLVDKNGRTALMLAAIYGQSAVALKLIGKGANVNEKDNDGMTALKLAVSKGRSDIATMLIENGAKVDEKDNDGMTALMLAVSKGRSDIATMLIEKGAKVDEKNEVGRTALMLAAKKGQSAVALKLIEKGAKVDDKDDDGRTVLMFATEKGQSDVALKLIEKGAKVDVKDDNGWTALMIAVSNSRSDIATMLIEKGANVDEMMEVDRTVLMFATENGQSDVALKLIEKGAKLDEKADDGKTALRLAIEKGQSAVALKLIEKGANVDERDNDGKTALRLAIEKGQSAVALKLIEMGVKIDEKYGIGMTALTLGIKKDQSDVALKLIEMGVKIDEKYGIFEETALMYAIKWCRSNIATMLIERGAKVDEKDIEGRTALMHAAEKGLSDVALKLIENGAKVNEKDNNDRTALMLAAEYGQSAVALKLIENGAKVNEKDIEGRTALMHAAEKGHSAVALKLIEKGAKVNERDNHDMTALMLAIEKGHSAVALKLIEMAAKVDEKNGVGMTALMLAIEKGQSAVALKLIEKGAKVDEKDIQGRTALMLAAEKCQSDVTLKLIKNGAKKNEKDNDGKSVLMYFPPKWREAMKNKREAMKNKSVKIDGKSTSSSRPPVMTFNKAKKVEGAVNITLANDATKSIESDFPTEEKPFKKN